jgi:hypothetical protein
MSSAAGGAPIELGAPVHVPHDAPWERRDVLGVHAQKQVSVWAGCVLFFAILFQGVVGCLA